MRSPRPLLFAAFLVAALAGCGGAGGTTRLDAGQEGSGETAPATASSVPPTAASTLAVSSSSTTTSSTTTSSSPAPVEEGSAPSPADGLTAAELKAAVAAPHAGARRPAAGPTVDQIVLADGTRVWRVRIPGAFPARSARVSVSVGTRLIGEGVLAPDLGAITAVTTDGSGLGAGAPVSFQWEGASPTPAGVLEVAR